MGANDAICQIVHLNYDLVNTVNDLYMREDVFNEFNCMGYKVSDICFPEGGQQPLTADSVGQGSYGVANELRLSPD
eukprot:13641621-Heterocapsa_arctica.AAC.1